MANIVHFGKYYYPDAGGIESVTESLAKGAAAAGHSVSVVCFARTPSDGEAVIDGVRVIRCSVAKLLASQPIGLRYIVKCISVARKSEVVHLHAPNMLGALCALLIGSRVRLLVHWHSDVINKGLLGRILRPLEAALLRRADCVVATSQVYADASETLRPFRSKVSVVPIGVPDVELDGPDGNLSASIEGLVAEKKVILAVGRLVSYKGFSVLIQAAKQLPPDSVVVIVGGGPLREDLQHELEAAGVAGRVVLVGRIDDATLHALFARATLYCLPSITRAEAFGVVLLEAMAYGLPIVATDILGSGVPWVNQHDTSGLNVRVGDSVALADACRKILASPELHRRLSQGARRRFLTEFSEENSIRRMLLTYDRILAAGD